MREVLDTIEIMIKMSEEPIRKLISNLCILIKILLCFVPTFIGVYLFFSYDPMTMGGPGNLDSLKGSMGINHIWLKTVGLGIALAVLNIIAVVIYVEYKEKRNKL